MIDVVVSRRRDEAEAICSFELARRDGAALPDFAPGAHIDVHLPGGLIRQYSLCPGPSEAGRYLIAVLHEPASRGGSAAMHALRPGDHLQISAPRNHFALVASAERSILVAGGIGITPLLAMADRLAARGAEFVLHYCARSRRRMAFAGRIRTGPWSARARFHLDDEAAAQRLDLETVAGAPRPADHLYVCGPAGFMASVLDRARAHGWRDAQLHRESFTAESRPSATTDDAFDVQLGRGGPIYRVPAGRSVVEVLAERGVVIPVSCEQGVCGTCLTRVLDGQPDHRDVYLMADERIANDRFTPCCSRARSPTLVLDLSVPSTR